MGWTEHAKCRTTEHSVDFTPDTDDLDPEQTAEALAPAVAFCQDCPVRVSCLESALQAEMKTPRWLMYGVFGGKTPLERWQIRQERKAA
jgi:hypothetical protein